MQKVNNLTCRYIICDRSIEVQLSKFDENNVDPDERFIMSH